MIRLDELTFENIGIWPPVVKWIVIAIGFVVLLLAGFWFDTRSQFSALDNTEKQEVLLEQRFETKHNLAVNLEAYQGQLKLLEKHFGQLLHQLPSETEVPGLLEDISKVGKASGLAFKLFKPMPEEPLDFYAELPINMEVVGDYHQLGQFISRIAALGRIVTLHDFTIKNESQKSGANKQVDAKLVMNIIAKTYRYTEENASKSKGGKQA